MAEVYISLAKYRVVNSLNVVIFGSAHLKFISIQHSPKKVFQLTVNYNGYSEYASTFPKYYITEVEDEILSSSYSVNWRTTD